LLYWYQSTNISALGEAIKVTAPLGTHFTCFTGTKVQILTQKAPLVAALRRARETQSGSTARFSLYLLYWYKY
jgi:hypothetical protein